MTEIQWPDAGPETDVWNHIHSGIDHANFELDTLPEGLRQLTKKLGRALVEIKSRVVLESGERAIDVAESLLQEPWVRFAADLCVAENGIHRSTQAIDRYLELSPVSASRSLSENAQRYLREAVETFLFGFEPACIALCRATLEQVLKTSLLEQGALRPAEARGPVGAGKPLLDRGRQAGLLVHTWDAAERVVSRGNHVLHRGIYDDSVLRQMAADSIRDLTECLHEVATAA